MQFTEILAAVCVVAGVLLLRLAANLLPSLLACVLWWKECLNLENSVRLSRDRNIFAAYLVLPFCLTVAENRLYCPDFLKNMESFPYFACICGIFGAYCLLRTAAAYIAPGGRIQEKTYKSALRSSYTFFCILVPVMLIASGICSFTDISETVTRSVTLYSALAVYALSIFRKFQIFHNSCSFFTAFLYLCVLEILPTGILVSSAVFL